MQNFIFGAVLDTNGLMLELFDWLFVSSYSMVYFDEEL